MKFVEFFQTYEIIHTWLLLHNFKRIFFLVREVIFFSSVLYAIKTENKYKSKTNCRVLIFFNV